MCLPVLLRLKLTSVVLEDRFLYQDEDYIGNHRLYPQFLNHPPEPSVRHGELEGNFLPRLQGIRVH